MRRRLYSKNFRPPTNYSKLFFKFDPLRGPGEEVPAISRTKLTDKTELFVEFPALVEGKTSKFAAHFTVLDKHRPVREGTVTVSLIKGDQGIRNTAEAPTAPNVKLFSTWNLYQIYFYKN